VQIFKWLVDVDEFLYVGDAIQDDLYSILLNPASSFQNGVLLNFWGGWKEAPDNVWTDRWNGLRFCMEVMTLKVTSITPNGARLNFWSDATFEPILDLDEILHGDDDIENDLSPCCSIP
jgi:hypothetical protein